LKIIEKATIRKYKIDEPIANEIKIQSFITHPNIIKLYCYYADDNHLHLLMELASDGDLYKYAK
jgi:serine/threonine protein kinase